MYIGVFYYFILDISIFVRYADFCIFKHFSRMQITKRASNETL